MTQTVLKYKKNKPKEEITIEFDFPNRKSIEKYKAILKKNNEKET